MNAPASSISVERASPASQEEMLDFLRAHEDSTLFLLNNFENYGAALAEAPYSGNFKLIRSGNRVTAVFCFTRKGNLLIEAPSNDSLFDPVLKACQQESMPLKGVVGNWEFCEPFWEYLKAKKIIQKELFASKEILYNIDLKKQDLPSQPNVRLLKENDYDPWRLLRRDYLIGEGVPNDLTDSQLLDLFFDKVKKRITWGFFLNDKLVSVADLNAKVLDLGQVGGVYTDPKFRRRGYSRAVMRQLLHDVKRIHSMRKLIIFTGKNNFAAQKLYSSLGAFQVGHFALLFGEPFR